MIPPVTASEEGSAQSESANRPSCSLEAAIIRVPRSSVLERTAEEGDSPVQAQELGVRCAFEESSCLGLQLKSGGKFHPKLNTGERPIANKYCEGKMQRTLKRELKST